MPGNYVLIANNIFKRPNYQKSICGFSAKKRGKMREQSIPHKVVDEFIEGLSGKQTLKEASLEALREALYSGPTSKDAIKSILAEDLNNEDS